MNNTDIKEICKADSLLSKILPPIKPCYGILYIPSQFAISFEYKNRHYVFNTLTKQCLETVLPETLWAGTDKDFLIENMFMVPKDKDEAAYYSSISTLIRAYKKKKGIEVYTILPTLGCNARCIYCYEEGMKQNTMTSDVIEQTVRFVLDTHNEKQITLSWFGGEPLLYPHIIDYICKGVREAGIQYKSIMTSNGSLITPEIVKKMKEDWKLEHIQISMDGGEQDYFIRKQYYKYQDTYHKVIRAINQMSEAGIAVTVRCNVDENNWDGIPAFLHDLSNEISNKTKVGVYFGPLNEVRRSNNDVIVWKKVKNARSLIENSGFKVAKFLGSGLKFRVNYCMADRGNVVITPDGSLFPCEHCPPESRFGDIWNGITDDYARIEFCRVDRVREKCKTCPFLPDCTSFAACPVKDTHCRDVREMLTLDALYRLVDKKIESENLDRESSVC